MKKILTTILVVLVSISASAQWTGAETGLEVLPMHPCNYDLELATDVMGNSWHWFYQPKAVSEGSYDITLQSITPEGKLRFGETGKVLSDKKNISFTQVNQVFLACKDSSMMVFVQDWRLGGPSYTVYRLDKDGNNLWGEDGITISDTTSAEMPCCISATELPNGNVAVVWQDWNPATSKNAIAQQILSPKGEKLLGEHPVFYNCKLEASWPIVVSDEQGGYLVNFGRGSNWYLAVQKFNDKGEAQWASDIVLSKKSGWLGRPMWCMRDVKPSGDGGLVVAWYDSRDNGNLQPYISYIKNDGTSGFVTADGGWDQLVKNDGTAVIEIKVQPDPSGKGFFVLMIDYPQSTYKRPAVQYVAKDGELLYGLDGRILESFSDYQSLAYLNLSTDNSGHALCSWLRKDYYSDQTTTIKTELVNMTDGTPIWQGEDSIRTYLDGEHECGHYQLEKANDHWVAMWYNAGNYEEGLNYNGNQTVYAQRINFDGSVGMPDAFNGDVNGDGTVDISDVNAVIAVICGNTANNLADANNLAGINNSADVNGDGTVDISDVNAIISKICGE